ncbi:hypothetical protein FHS68_003373 [Dyadobacter arcticus]|uniref:Uncharacterized protein n=1 Tax=Dyadobacter arcticus TaxID=1078754 RepID=A0ABX0UMK3_9BACT|nr:hypothetical protein [Dyadobacter arcticus]
MEVNENHVVKKYFANMCPETCYAMYYIRKHDEKIFITYP